MVPFLITPPYSYPQANKPTVILEVCVCPVLCSGTSVMSDSLQPYEL